jgi:nickel/cobalt transporter (NicO) family protein
VIETGASVVALVASACGIAFIHTFAPDHWMPFAALARAQRWSRFKLARVTFVASLGHVGASVAIGAAGLWLGWALDAIQFVQGSRGEWALYLLIAFGLGYALWGVYRARRWRLTHPHADGSVHAHEHGLQAHSHPRQGAMTTAPRVTTWALFVVLVLGPCEALVPLMFAGAQVSLGAVVWTTAAFGLSTMATMVGLALLAHAGFRLVRWQLLEKHVHTLTGLAISVTAALVMVLGI